MSNRKATPDVLGAVLGDTRQDIGDDIGSETDAPPREPATPARRDPKPATGTPAAAVSPAPVGAGAAAAWEYLTVVLGDHHGLRPKSLNGQPLEQWKAQPVLGDFLTIVGRYGWEMVGIVDITCGEKEAYFKRPQQE